MSFHIALRSGKFLGDQPIRLRCPLKLLVVLDLSFDGGIYKSATSEYSSRYERVSQQGQCSELRTSGQETDLSLGKTAYHLRQRGS